MLSFRRALIGTSLSLMAAGPGLAGAQRDDVRVVLDGVEPAVAGLRVQVYDDALAPQLVVENLSGRALEILDDAGRPFVRIRTPGVDADLAAAAWYQTLSPGGAPVPQRAHSPGAAAEWRTVRAHASWGWFDPRIGKDRASLYPASLEPVALGDWRVPARLGGETIEIRGHFLYQPRPPGVFVARVTSAGELAPKVRVSLSPGRPPALLLENAGDTPVTVLGVEDEPFLRISVEGVDANLASPTWQDQGRYRGLTDVTAGGPPRWQRISLARRYSWLEPRAGMPAIAADAGARPDNTRAKVKAWQVPVRVGTKLVAIQGIVEWVPLPSAVEPRD